MSITFFEPGQQSTTLFEGMESVINIKSMTLSRTIHEALGWAKNDILSLLQDGPVVEKLSIDFLQTVSKDAPAVGEALKSLFETMGIEMQGVDKVLTITGFERSPFTRITIDSGDITEITISADRASSIISVVGEENFDTLSTSQIAGSVKASVIVANRKALPHLLCEIAEKTITRHGETAVLHFG